VVHRDEDGASIRDGEIEREEILARSRPAELAIWGKAARSTTTRVLLGPRLED
jgi:hypothetical protein